MKKLIRKFKKTSKTCKMHRVYRVFTVSIVAMMIISIIILNLCTTAAFAAKTKNSLDSCIMINTQIIYSKLQKNNKSKVIKEIHNTNKIVLYKNSIKIMKCSLISEVQNYIDKNAKKHKMHATYIVNKCIKKQFDISLLLSQAHLESNFGDNMEGNSCFGMKGYRFPTIMHAIDAYIELMQTKYMLTRTPEQLISSNFTVENSTKYKYAGYGYGDKIKKIRKNIINNTKIHKLFHKIQNMNKLIAKLEENKVNSSAYFIGS